MRRNGFRLSMAATVVLVIGAAALAVAGASRAGSVDSTFDVSIQPPILTAGAEGFVKGEFTAASGPGSGTATHVVMTLDVPVALLDPTSTNCSPSSPAPAGFNRFRCDIGMVKAGDTVRRFVTFTAPSSPAVYTASGNVTFDKGAGGGAGGQNTTLTASGQTSVVAVGDTNRAGTCTGSASTPAVSQHDPQSTSVSGATAASSLGLPCTWVFVGEDTAPSGSGIVTEISFVGLPVTTSPATVVLDFFSLPAPLGSLTVFYLPNYPDGPNPLTAVPLAGCVGGALPAGQTACLLSLVPLGTSGARATILVLGTGGDPGWGMG